MEVSVALEYVYSTSDKSADVSGGCYFTHSDTKRCFWMKCDQDCAHLMAPTPVHNGRLLMNRCLCNMNCCVHKEAMHTSVVCEHEAPLRIWFQTDKSSCQSLTTGPDTRQTIQYMHCTLHELYMLWEPRLCITVPSMNVGSAGEMCIDVKSQPTFGDLPSLQAN